MKNQSGTIKTNLELDRVVIGGSGGYRRLSGGSDDFSLQTDKQTLHHNIYISIIIIITIIILIIITKPRLPSASAQQPISAWPSPSPARSCSQARWSPWPLTLYIFSTFSFFKDFHPHEPLLEPSLFCYWQALRSDVIHVFFILSRWASKYTLTNIKVNKLSN